MEPGEATTTSYHASDEFGRILSGRNSARSDGSMQERQSVLIVDDDPLHLRIYGWIVEAAGFRALPAEVRFAGFDLPEEPADLVLLDYNLLGRTTAVEVAKLIHARRPGVPVIVLSDSIDLPQDIAPLVQGFVRKGDPAKLVDRVQKILRTTSVTTARQIAPEEDPR
jgi:DNA-binding response OmpR family regulator